LHVFSASYLSFVLAPTPAILIGRLFGKRVVLNYRSGQADDHLRRWRTAVPTIRLATRVVVPSGYLADVFVRYGIAARVVSNFVQPERFPFRVRERFRPIFLANRNFEAHYNVACILRAFRRIQRRYPEARLLLAGDGPERADLERLRSNLGLRDVRFLGPVAPERMPALYGEADIYLNAPNIDNMPVSVLEAYAAGLPVVTTDAGGIPYIVRDGETGLLVPRDDDRALADAAIRVIEDPDLGRRLVRNAHRECQAKYVWSAVRDEWRSLYREIVEHDG
ncbi:MAG: glycosyltransferase family 4 protein, partial [Gemmatimonadota bacterium]